MSACKHGVGTKTKGDWLVCKNCETPIAKATQPKRGWPKDAKNDRRKR